MTALTVSFPPPTKPWSTNDDRRFHPHQRAEHIRQWKTATLIAWRQAEHGPLGQRGVVTLQIPFAQNRRRDPHNYCGTVLKAVVDGLVRAGVWPDDTPEWVGHREPVLLKGGLVVVTIEPEEVTS